MCVRFKYKGIFDNNAAMRRVAKRGFYSLADKNDYAEREEVRRAICAKSVELAQSQRLLGVAR